MKIILDYDGTKTLSFLFPILKPIFTISPCEKIQDQRKLLRVLNLQMIEQDLIYRKEDRIYYKLIKKKKIFLQLRRNRFYSLELSLTHFLYLPFSRKRERESANQRLRIFVTYRVCVCVYACESREEESDFRWKSIGRQMFRNNRIMRLLTKLWSIAVANVSSSW